VGDGTRVFAQEQGSNVCRLWDLGTGKELGRYTLGGNSTLMAPLLLAGGRHLACASWDDPVLRVFRLSDGVEVGGVDLRTASDHCRLLALGADSRTIYAATRRGVVLELRAQLDDAGAADAKARDAAPRARPAPRARAHVGLTAARGQDGAVIARALRRR